MVVRVVTLSETDEHAARALTDLQVRKDPAIFAQRSILLGERLGVALLENENRFVGISPPFYYKLRDARYVWHGLLRAIPEAQGRAIFTQRQGQGYSSVEVEANVADIVNPQFTAFVDPMLARGTTALSVSRQIVRGRRFDRFATLHCFAAEEGISALQTKLTDFCDDYLMIVGKRGFHVDASGYMGAIRREMDWGDVQDSTYFLEYPAEKEIEVVLGELASSGGLDIVMASILMVLRAHEQHRHSIRREDPAIPTEGFIHAVTSFVKLDRFPLPIALDDWELSGFYPRSETVRRALDQLMSEDFVRRLEDEAYPTYMLTVWGQEYLRKVYVPVLSRHVEGLYYPLVDGIQEIVEKYVGSRFGTLARLARGRCAQARRAR